MVRDIPVKLDCPSREQSGRAHFPEPCLRETRVT